MKNNYLPHPGQTIGYPYLDYMLHKRLLLPIISLLIHSAWGCQASNVHGFSELRRHNNTRQTIMENFDSTIKLPLEQVEKELGRLAERQKEINRTLRGLNFSVAEQEGREPIDSKEEKKKEQKALKERQEKLSNYKNTLKKRRNRFEELLDMRPQTKTGVESLQKEVKELVYANIKLSKEIDLFLKGEKKKSPIIDMLFFSVIVVASAILIACIYHEDPKKGAPLPNSALPKKNNDKRSKKKKKATSLKKGVHKKRVASDKKGGKPSS